MHPSHFLAAAVICSSIASAQPTREIDEALVEKLINLRSQNRTPGIAVAMILEGSVKAGPFETNHVRRVVTVHPVVVGGKSTRRMNTYDFHWNPIYGWFLWEMREDPAGDIVWIWSEIRGEVIIR